MGRAEKLKMLQNIFDTRINIVATNKPKSEFYTFITPRDCSAMIGSTENLLKLVEGLQSEAITHN